MDDDFFIWMVILHIYDLLWYAVEFRMTTMDKKHS
jgi:hypothetical protein